MVTGHQEERIAMTSPNDNGRESKDYGLQMAKEHDVKFIRLWFTDILGSLKSVAVTLAEPAPAAGGGRRAPLSPPPPPPGRTPIRGRPPLHPPPQPQARFRPGVHVLRGPGVGVLLLRELRRDGVAGPGRLL